MESFGDHLTTFARRLGVSDAELARAIGVSRQTIFRWREGATRPRHRDDVLALARKLRLSAAERDTLLLAAGFPPVEMGHITTPGGLPPPGSEPSAPLPAADEAPSRPRGTTPPRRGILALLLVTLLGLMAVGGWALWQRAGQGSGAETGRLAAPVVTPAAPGETLVLVTQFANYTGKEVSYNVAGRLVEALAREPAAQGAPLRLAIWPDEVRSREAAIRAGQAVSATLVIFGEYDSGRVVAAFAVPTDAAALGETLLEYPVSDPQALTATINVEVPQQVRSLALLALGQLAVVRGEPERAGPLLEEARAALAADSAASPRSRALVDFFLGIAHSRSVPPDLDAAIAAYSRALAAHPALVSARLNRSAAYAARQKPGDLLLALADANELVAAQPDEAAGYINRSAIRVQLGAAADLQAAHADLDRALALDPERPESYVNRGALRLRLGGAENLRLAVVDFDEAIAREPNRPEPYVNRAAARFRLGEPMGAIVPDLDRALALRPDDGDALNLRCWGHALENDPATALPFCERGVAATDHPLSRDSRAVAYALAGQREAAIADFEHFIAWAAQQPDAVWADAAARRRGWVAALRAGKQPFTPALLADLRQE